MSKKIKNIRGYIKADQEVLEEIDYIDQLNPKEHEWLARFADNFYNARFLKDGTDPIKNREEQLQIDRAKKKREKDISNNCIASASGEKDSGVQELSPGRILTWVNNPNFKSEMTPHSKNNPKYLQKYVYAKDVKGPNKKRVKRASKQAQLAPAKTIESLDEWLAKGNVITKIKGEK